LRTAEVAISTVSLVMNGKGYVSPEMRARVRSAARKLRYVPRHAARSLPSQRTGNVGFVLREDHFWRTEPFYTRIYLGTEFEVAFGDPPRASLSQWQLAYVASMIEHAASPRRAARPGM